MMMARSNRQTQRGVTLLEVLIAMLIFAVGVLGLVGLQARAVAHSAQAKYRADASLLANELIGQMWTDARTPTALQNNFASTPAGAKFAAWQTKVATVLPGADLFPPEVTITSINPLASATPVAGLQPSTQVTIVLRWKPPNVAAAEAANNLTVTTEIK
jgi:type IV pilus assembly protein PilV